MNLVFFLGILRILVGKLRMSDAQRNEFNQYKWVVITLPYFQAVFEELAIAQESKDCSYLLCLSKYEYCNFFIFFLLAFTRRLIKSTFFLVALFGLHYILFVFLPVEVSSTVFKIRTFAELALSSTQVTCDGDRNAQSTQNDKTTLTVLSLLTSLRVSWWPCSTA